MTQKKKSMEVVCPHLLNTGETASQIQCTVLRFPVQGRHGHIRESPVKGLNNDYGTRVSFTQGKAKSIHCSEWISERPKGSYPCG